VEREAAALPDGRVAVIGVDIGSVEALTPWEAKGLEFDTVILVEPSAILTQEHGLSLLYVAVTRATHRLVIVHGEPLPEVVTRALA